VKRHPLCAWVIEREGRFCHSWPAYRLDGKSYCGRHARLVGATEAMLRPRRHLYRRNLTNPSHTVKTSTLNTLIGVETMPFVVEAKAGGEYNAEDYAPAGIYMATVESVQPFEGTKYMSDEKQIQARITWTITDGRFAGKKAERLYSPSLNEKSRLYPVFQALTGITPTPGQEYDIEAMLVGRSAQIVVMQHTTQAGYQRTRVENVLPLQQAPKAKKTRVIEVEDDEDDDLAGT